MTDLKSASARVQSAADQLKLTINVKQLAQSTRTAEDAAKVCDCEVGQIVKSMIFQGAESNNPVLLLVSGSNRVNEKRAVDYCGEKVKRPNADYVREITGYAIGGIPPIAHATPLKTYIDRDLLQYDIVWAAAGTPNSIFSVNPSALAEASAATIVDLS